ncbi:hypothetical protein FOL47_007748 [Perkinsus chesapeaki]|uniref:Uncharacterized protein n=1 Tax=Perkinsus chesapeaki TaxID=330153 RepID=A0A7J6MW65_PERCH|nr:hypothetical protein FOL47_007748 [Perkinsus chesapeaki]
MRLSSFIITLGRYVSAEGFAGGAQHYEFITEVRQHCVQDAVDAHDNLIPCKESRKAETLGMTLPGMEDGILTTRSHTIVTADGEVAVEAHPSHPYQYFMNIKTADSYRVEHLVGGRSYLVGEIATHPRVAPTFGGSATLEEDEWTFDESRCAGNTCEDVWTKDSLVEPGTPNGIHFTAMYSSNLMPNKWTLYMNHYDYTPLRIVASNDMHEGTVHQEVIFKRFHKHSGHLSVLEARERLLDIYQTKSDARGLSPVEAGGLAGHTHHFRSQLLHGMIPEISRLPSVLSDWHQINDSTGVATIRYDIIEPGSAADLYFSALEDRRVLNEVMDFEYPKGCAKKNISDHYCLSVDANETVAEDQFSLEAGITIPDVHHPADTATLKLHAILGLKNDNGLALDFSLEAQGCAVVWQGGVVVSLAVTACLSAHATGHDLLDPATRTFSGAITVSIIFHLKIPKWHVPAAVQVDGTIGCSAHPSNNITAFGRLGVTVSVPHAGASMIFDLAAATTDHKANRWEFASGVSLSAPYNFLDFY